MFVHEMKLAVEPFEKIRNREKDIEMRLYDDKRQLIKVGDRIRFLNIVTDERLLVDVIGLHVFDSFEDLYEFYPKERLGYKENEVANSDDMNQYYPYGLRSIYQVIAIEIKLVHNARPKRKLPQRVEQLTNRLFKKIISYCHFRELR